MMAAAPPTPPVSGSLPSNMAGFRKAENSGTSCCLPAAVRERDGLVDHGVADAIHGAGELLRDAGIDVRIVAAEAV